MTPKWGSIENTFIIMKHYTKVNAYTKYGSNQPKNLRENLHQRQNCNFLLSFKPQITPKWGPIKNSFPLMKHYA